MELRIGFCERFYLLSRSSLKDFIYGFKINNIIYTYRLILSEFDELLISLSSFPVQVMVVHRSVSETVDPLSIILSYGVAIY